MIKPTIGRVVWFYPAGTHSDSQPNAALVAYVHSDTMINVGGFDHNGMPFSTTSVPLLQDDAPIPAVGCWATWMPYQKGQAAKTEALERQIPKEDGV